MKICSTTEYTEGTEIEEKRIDKLHLEFSLI